MKIRRHWIPTLSLIASLGIAGSPHSSVWAGSYQISPAGLGARQTIGPFSIEPPAGYAYRTLRNGGGAASAWVGNVRADKTRGWVMIAPLTLTGSDVGAPARKILNAFVLSVGRDRTNFKVSNYTPVSLSGRTFYRAIWTGDAVLEEGSAHELGGVIYVSKVGSIYYELSTQDVIPDHQQALKAAEASLVTFKLN